MKTFLKYAVMLGLTAFMLWMSVHNLDSANAGVAIIFNQKIGDVTTNGTISKIKELENDSVEIYYEGTAIPNTINRSEIITETKFEVGLVYPNIGEVTAVDILENGTINVTVEGKEDPINFPEKKTVPITDQLIIAWGKANKTFLLLSGLCALISHLVRAERWKLLLNPLGYHFSTFNSFLSVLTGYFVNLLIPRGGEVSRCVTLYRLNRIPINTSLGTVIAERVIDLIFLIICIAGAFFIEFDVLIAFINDYKIQHANDATKSGGVSLIVWIALGLVVAGAIGFLIIRSQKELYEGLLIKIKNFLLGLKEGVVSIFKLEKNVLFIFYSVLIWVLYYFMAYFVIIAFPESEHLGLMAALSIFVIGGIAMAMPVPGGAGSYHLFVSAGLVFLYDLPSDQAFAFTTIFHGWQTLVVIVFGAASLFLSQILAKKDVPKQSAENS